MQFTGAWNQAPFCMQAGGKNGITEEDRRIYHA